jgi:Transposase DDE domain
VVHGRRHRGLESRTTPGGQPHYSDLAITTALTLCAVFRLPLRQTEGLIGSVLRLLGLDLPVPNFSTLSRRAQSLELPAQPRPPGGPIHLLIDSSGLKLSGPGEWLGEKHGTSKRRSAAHRLRRGERPDRRFHPDRRR